MTAPGSLQAARVGLWRAPPTRSSASPPSPVEGLITSSTWPAVSLPSTCPASSGRPPPDPFPVSGRLSSDPLLPSGGDHHAVPPNPLYQFCQKENSSSVQATPCHVI